MAVAYIIQYAALSGRAVMNVKKRWCCADQRPLILIMMDPKVLFLCRNVFETESAKLVAFIRFSRQSKKIGQTVEGLCAKKLKTREQMDTTVSSSLFPEVDGQPPAL